MNTLFDHVHSTRNQSIQSRRPPLVPDPHPNDPRSAIRRRDALAHLHDPRRIHPPRRLRNLQLPPPRVALPPKDLHHHPRRTRRRRRIRDAHARAHAHGALREHQTRSRLRRPPLPTRRPRRPPHRTRSNPRRSHHRPHVRLSHKLQAVPPQPLPDPNQVPRRSPPPRRFAPLPRVHHEGRLLLPP